MNGLFEGDIIPDHDSILKNYGNEVVEKLEEEGILDRPTTQNDENANGVTLQNVVRNQRWNTRVNGVVQIPYVLDSRFSIFKVNTIKNALRDLSNRSKVVQFNPRKNERDYIYVSPFGGCSSYVGKVGGRQELTLQGGCASKGITQHEFIHALGLYHEQSRPDRDEYVKINWQNIQNGMEYNFEKNNGSSTLGNKYDYNSVMHYENDAFSSNGRVTITPLKPLNGKILGQRKQADNQDIIDIQLLYQCVSGPRNLSQYNSNRCTNDCKCWEGALGCKGNNNACQGSLVCRNNKCVDSGFGGRKPPGGNWRLIKNSGKCLTVSKKNRVFVWKCFSNDNQKWFYNEQTRTIKSKEERNLCLTRNGTGRATVQTCTGMLNQKWSMTDRLGSLVSFKNDNGLCLTKDSQSIKVLANTECSFKPTQRFKIV